MFVCIECIKCYVSFDVSLAALQQPRPPIPFDHIFIRIPLSNDPSTVPP
jgi:hypothetical protein